MRIAIETDWPISQCGERGEETHDCSGEPTIDGGTVELRWRCDVQIHGGLWLTGGGVVVFHHGGFLDIHTHGSEGSHHEFGVATAQCPADG